MSLQLFVYFGLSDEDLAGDLLLAEAKLPLKKILPQTQMKFQVTLEKPDLRVSQTTYSNPIALKCSFHSKSISY